MQYLCCDERRREAVQAHGTVNGIDYLEVLDRDAPSTLPEIERQKTLLVRCFKPVPALTGKHVVITEGVRRTPVTVLWAAPASAVSFPPGTTLQEAAWFAALPETDHLLVVRTNSTGDHSNYQLHLREDANGPVLLQNFDPRLSSVEFSFKVECPSEFDCRPQRVCPPTPADLPDIDYLAKDYGSFRRLMLDRMALLAPAWRDRHAADQGMALVELLAYVGDRLSYQQDAIATEAYIGTARRRVSVRRHARLVDYFMHDGCNARTWVHVKVAADVELAQGTPLLTSIPEMPPRIDPASTDYSLAMRERPVVFETMHPVKLFPANDEFHFYTWGDRRCCLPKGATRATLQNKKGASLEKGMVLVFVEQLGPHTGLKTDADPMKRHAVRLTDVQLIQDPVGGRFKDTPGDDAVDVIEISWGEEDALSFPFCVSGVTDPEHGAKYTEDISVALGNTVLADHGRTLPGPAEELGPVPKAIRGLVEPSADRCQPPQSEFRPPRFRPHLKELPVTQIGHVPVESYQNGRKHVVFKTFDGEKSAAAAFRWEAKHILPGIHLEDSSGNGWKPVRDLLSSDAFDPCYVVEVEENGEAVLRFGDGEHGLALKEDMTVFATYRIGNGTAGNIGADSLVHIVTNQSDILRVTNPLAARGGMEPESMEDVRQRAPVAFRTQERAVTEEDYARVAGQYPGVQRAVATFRWTGSWYTVFLTVDRVGGTKVDEPFKDAMRSHLERYRLAGRDVEVNDPVMVPLEIELHVCAKPDYFRSDVKETLLEVFSSRYLPDGSQGFFHPDRFSFGQPLYLSRLYDSAQAVAGVASVKVKTFQRQNIPTRKYLDTGKLTVDRREIVRLDNDKNFPEHGVLRVNVGGGK